MNVLGNIGSTAQKLAADVDNAARRIGNVAEQIASASATVSRAVNTPLVITTPTPTTTGTIRPALPTWAKVTLLVLGGLVAFKLFSRGGAS